MRLLLQDRAGIACSCYYDFPLDGIPEAPNPDSGLAPSLFNLSNVSAFLNSDTLRCLKYVTQLRAHSPSKPRSSFPHTSFTFSFSLMLSTMLLPSRHAKNRSRASQQCWRWLRSGAMYAPSFEGDGAEADVDFVVGDEEKRPMTNKPSEPVRSAEQTFVGKFIAIG